MSDYDTAFNEGCNARLAGIGIKDNPYRGDRQLRDAWAAGWRDTQYNWGKWAKWPVKPLPPLNILEGIG